MKKIMSDKSFWLILAISFIVLVGLTIGVIFLTRENAKTFYSAGYIINSNATKTDKYYFDDNTVYKENVFNEYVFKDVDNKEVNTSKDNFIHYLDNSLSFMKNGVILDLDNFNENVVPYYNITDKSIVKHSNGSYYIENADKTLVLGNFLGRITDNKYIVVGNDISVKLAGNEEAVKGNYFEILFVENGVVKIENKDGSYQTISEGTTIYVGDDIKINLGDKSVSQGDEVKLSLSELTIDGNENIDIIPEGVVDKDEDKDEAGEGAGGNNMPGTGGEENTPPDGDAGNEENTTILKKEVSVNLIGASTDANSISTKFQVIDTADAINADLVVTLVNTTTGVVVYGEGGKYDPLYLADALEVQDRYFTKLTSDCNYVLTVTDINGVQYFQKSFRTGSINLKLKRELVLENALTYSLDFGEESNIISATVYLKDEKGNDIVDYVINNGGDNTFTFEGLTNNTLYKVVVDNIVIDNVQYDDVYKIVTSDMTLKERPVLGNVHVKTNDNAKTFILSMDKPTDDDKAIVKYTYQIFKSDDITEETISTASPVYSFTRSKLDDEILKLDELKNLYGDTDYRFKVVVQYYDNYRYNEIETILSDEFLVEGNPTITFKPDKIDFDRISGTVEIDDTMCTIPFEGRECNDNKNEFVIRYYGATTPVGGIAIENVVVDSEKQMLYFDLNGLQENSLYAFKVFANVDGEEEVQVGKYIGGFIANTTGISALMMQNWGKGEYSFDNPILVNTEITSTGTDNTSIDKLYSVTFNLYRGNVTDTIESSSPIASYTVSGNIKDKFYDKTFTIKSSSFMYMDSALSELVSIENLDVLRKISGTLGEQYTIEITDAYDETGTNEFRILNNIYVYDTPTEYILEDRVASPNVIVDEITNIEAKSNEYVDYGITYNNNLDDEIVRGYKVTADFDKAKIDQVVGYGAIKSINFYANRSTGGVIETKTIDFKKEENYTVYFVLGNGTYYDIIDKTLSRGNSYTFSFDVNIDDGESTDGDIVFPTNKPVSDVMTPVKQAPNFRLYVDSSTKDSITYKYQVFDYDNALYKEVLEEEGEAEYYIHYNILDNDTQYTTLYVKDGSSDSFTLSNLGNGMVYNIMYYSALHKGVEPSLVSIGNYYFDGFYDGKDYGIKYELEYGNFDNRLKIIVNENEFLNRVSAYLLTLEANGDKYEKVISNLDLCDDRKCVVIDYKDIAKFKGKDVTVKLDAFYDTGYVGFGQESLLGDYFKNLGYVSYEDASKVGFVYQTTEVGEPGSYFYVTNSGYSSFYSYPRGILGFELNSTDKMSAIWKLNTVNMVDISNNKFVNYGDIKFNNSNVIVGTGKVNILNEKINVVPKVLDKIAMNSDDNSFRFTSITPKVYAIVNPVINGATMKITVSLDPDTLKTDFVKVDGKYKFYVDIYEKSGEELSLVKTVVTDYDSLSSVTFDMLDPASEYYYKISADMNKNGENVKTPLFDYNKSGYIEFLGKFNTLNEKDIFKDVTYGYTSSITVDTYSHRELTINAHLMNSANFDVKYQLYDIEGNFEFEKVISNEDITFNKSKNIYNSIYTEDITGDDFVFGAGYHNLVITAVTTDENKNELVLYNGKLIDDFVKDKNFHKLGNPRRITLDQSAGRDIDKNDYNITSTIQITDTDRVIGGKFYIELQDSSYNNVCTGEDCMVTVSIGRNASGQYVGTCDKNNVKNVSYCNVVIGNDPNNASDIADTYTVVITFNGLKANTNYSTYVYANTYRNNYDVNSGMMEEANGFVYVRKNQYTKSSLDFSLGAVTPVAIDRNRLDISFVSSANLPTYLMGIKYTINIDGGDTVKSGVLGTYLDIDDNVVKSEDDLIFNGSSDYPTITITTDKVLGTNNYIIMEYFYKDETGNIYRLEDALGNTSFQYTVKNKN